MHDFATDNAPDALPRASSRRNWIAFFVALLVITGLIHSRTTRFWGRLFAGILGGPYVIGWGIGCPSPTRGPMFTTRRRPFPWSMPPMPA